MDRMPCKSISSKSIRDELRNITAAKKVWKDRAVASILETRTCAVADLDLDLDLDLSINRTRITDAASRNATAVTVAYQDGDV